MLDINLPPKNGNEISSVPLFSLILKSNEGNIEFAVT